MGLPNFPDNQQFTATEVAGIAGVHRKTVQRWCKLGYIPYKRIGTANVMYWHDIKRHLQQRANKKKA